MKPRMMGCPILRRMFVTLIPKQLYQRVPVVAPLRVVAPSLRQLQVVLQLQAKLLHHFISPHQRRKKRWILAKRISKRSRPELNLWL